MSIDDIYNLLQLWFCSWLIFQVMHFVSKDSSKIAGLIRGRGEKNG